MPEDKVFEAMVSQDLKLAELQKQIDLLNKEKELLQAKLDLTTAEALLAEQKLELVNSQATAERLNSETSLSVTTLKMDWLSAAKELEYLKGLMDEAKVPEDEARQGLCINFSNKLRLGAFKELEADSDEILVLKATAYETYYKACVHVIENRNLQFKLKARDRFAEAVKANRAKKSEKEQVKVERQRAQDPREKMIETLMTLGKMSREDAMAQVDKMNNVAKELVKK